MDASDVLEGFHVVPVIVVNDVNKAQKLAEIFLSAGFNCFEITLRTPNSLACIEAVASEFPQAITGAGSVVTPEQLQSAKSAGIKFAVSPGASTELLNAATSTALVPGAVTASEVMNLKSQGYKTVKFFPAELCGGIRAIRALCEPIQGVQFFPTGGIRENNLLNYLEFGRISCVGGSWLAPKSDVENDRWTDILARCTSLNQILSSLNRG